MKKTFTLRHLLKLGVLLLLGPQPVLAQTVLGDRTTDTTVTAVTQNSSFIVTGGTQSQTTLFHSFSEFSPIDTAVLFQLGSDQAAINAVIARVTGENSSLINGQLKLTGGNTPDLFFINPQGITFGPKAALQLPGSFTASTAENLLFSDGSTFSAINPSAINPSSVPLLTVSTVAGLQLGQRSGDIRVNNTGHSATRPGFIPLNLTQSPAGLSVQPQHSLTLAGRNVTLQGGVLSASSGNINLTAIQNGQFSTTPDHFGSHVVANASSQLGDIKLQDSSLVNVSGFGNGRVTLQGNDISLEDGSVVVEQTVGAQSGGILRLLANNITIAGSSNVVSQLRTQTLGPSAGGHLDVMGQHIVLKGGGAIGTDTYGLGLAGDITVSGHSRLHLDGDAVFDPSKPSSIASSTFGPGSAGDTTVIADSISIADAASISSATLGTGRGGTVLATARNDINIAGASPFSISSINSVTFGAGDAGDVVVTAPKIALSDSAGIVTTTFAGGDAGRLTINAKDVLEVLGLGDSADTATTPTTVSSAAFSLGGTPLQAVLGLPDIVTGNSEALTINAGRVVVADEGEISVSADGPGKTGNLTINAGTLTLRNRSEIKAVTVSGNGGEIALNIRQLLNLRNQSLLNAESFGTGDGGNISIVAPVVIGTHNSDINANAVTGNGGKIEILTQGLFGLAFRDRPTAQSDITANSDFGVSGTVDINRLGVDADAGLTVLSAQLTAPRTQVTKGCGVGTVSQFIASGRGGIVPSPASELSSGRLWTDTRDRFSQPNPLPTITLPHHNYEVTEAPTEATTWQVAASGNIELVATHPSLPRQDATCLDL